ncbi:hypothetical protein ACO0SA_002239 [Hanseniaspora valbyensis]
MENTTSGRVYVKPNIDNVLPYQQYIKSTTTFPSHTLPILFAGGRNLTLKIKDNGHITQEQLYQCIAEDTIGDVNLNVPNGEFDGFGVDCDFFVLDFGIIIWFNDFGYGIHITSRNIFYHGITEVNNNTTIRQGYSLCLLLDRNLDIELLNTLIGNCKVFGIELDSSTVNTNYEFNSHLYLNFTLVPKFGEFDRHYNAIPENLFFYEWFGVNRGDKLVYNIFDAVERCLEEVDSAEMKEHIGCSTVNVETTNSRQNSFSTVDFSDDLHQQEVLRSLNHGLADDL